MHQHTKFRILGLIAFLFFVGGTIYNWHLLLTQGKYYLKLSGLGPIGVIMGFALIFFPSLGEKPSARNKTATVVMIILAIVGFALGCVNFYLMDNYRPQ